MSAFLYYFPEMQSVGSSKHIPSKCGLADVLDGACFSSIPIPDGPDKKGGTLIAVDPAPESGGRQAAIQFDPVVQQWSPVENEDGEITHWMGYELNAKPKPVDLVRPSFTQGLALTLENQSWCIPLISMTDEATVGTTLPKQFVWRKGGVREMVVDRYQEICQKAKRQFDWFLKLNDFEDIDLADLVMEEYEQFYFACEVLQVNYRLSAPEICFLGLLDTTTILQVIRYTLGFPMVEAQLLAQKKSETPSDSSNM